MVAVAAICLVVVFLLICSHLYMLGLINSGEAASRHSRRWVVTNMNGLTTPSHKPYLQGTRRSPCIEFEFGATPLLSFPMTNS
ncbi:hypothetical protein EDB85DRAFT_1959286 [Lactarius pseudohatsudake]|nr:hypothetical protein EDB85DRAFT_1959286 [Lactarius pseudohatsudake]